MEAVSFNENLSLSRNVAITLKGGYDCSFSANPGFTTVHGNMTISGPGTVTVENVVIR